MAEKTAVAIMREAYNAEIDLWSYGRIVSRTGFTIWRGEEEMAVLATGSEAAEAYHRMMEEAGHCASLRALAEMEPTQSMLAAAMFHGNEDAAIFSGDEMELPVLEECRAYILAAAEEGKPE